MSIVQGWAACSARPHAVRLDVDACAQECHAGSIPAPSTRLRRRSSHLRPGASTDPRPGGDGLHVTDQARGRVAALRA
jgi:hypothetical protein